MECEAGQRCLGVGSKTHEMGIGRYGRIFTGKARLARVTLASPHDRHVKA